VTRSYYEKAAQNGAQRNIWSKLIHNLHRGKSCPKCGMILEFSKKPAQSKQSPNGRKFAQSGHPVLDQGDQILL
jgi:hypothetical protein